MHQVLSWYLDADSPDMHYAKGCIVFRCGWVFVCTSRIVPLCGCLYVAEIVRENVCVLHKRRKRENVCVLQRENVCVLHRKGGMCVVLHREREREREWMYVCCRERERMSVCYTERERESPTVTMTLNLVRR